MTPRASDLRWWRAERPYEAVSQIVNTIVHNQTIRRNQDEHHLRLYSDQEWRAIYGLDRRSTAVSRATGPKRRVSINIVKNMIDAAASLICRSRPAVTFLTDGADWDLHVSARKRERFVQAVFHKQNVHLTAQRMVKNALIFGTGVLYVFKEHGEIKIENVFPGELIVDDQEAIYGEPRSIYRCRQMDKLVLAELYPEYRDEIERATPPQKNYGGSDISGQVLVTEAWHLPSGPGADDGRHVVTIDTATLHEEPYKHDRFPFVIYRWNEEPLGFFGTGLAYELSGLQFEINTLVRLIQANMWTGGNLKVFVERGSKVQPAHLTNDLRGNIVEYTGRPPVFHSNDVVSPQIMNHLQYLVQTAYNVTGISQLTAQSQTPYASMSGRARLVHENSESQRFLTNQRRYEHVYRDAAELILDCAEDLVEEGENETVVFRGREHLEQISYSDVVGDRDSFDIEAFSSSHLPHTPGARLAMIQEMLESGLLDMTDAKRLLEFPDLQGENDLALAPYELIDERLSRILYDGEWLPPTPYMDLQYALKRAQLEVQRGEMRGAPVERVELLRDFHSATLDLIEASQPAAPPAAPPGGPPMPPGPMPPGAGAPAAPPPAPMPMA